MRTPSAKTKPAPSLRSVINATKKLWRQYHLSYDQTRYVSKEVRRALAIERTKIRQRVIARLSREEEALLITYAYRMKGERGLLIKTLFQTGARVSEFVNIKVEDVFFEEQMILIAKAKGGKSRYVPILPELAQELRTHLGQRTVGYLFETNRATCYSPRRIQVKPRQDILSTSAELTGSDAMLCALPGRLATSPTRLAVWPSRAPRRPAQGLSGGGNSLG